MKKKQIGCEMSDSAKKLLSSWQSSTEAYSIGVLSLKSAFESLGAQVSVPEGAKSMTVTYGSNTSHILCRVNEGDSFVCADRPRGLSMYNILNSVLR